MDRQRLDRWCEYTILGFILALLVFAPLATGAVRPRDFLVVQWLVVPPALVWMVRLWINPKLGIYWPPVCWAVLGFVGYACVRYLTAELEYVARQELIRILVYTTIFFLLIQNLRASRAAQIIAMVVICLAMVISFYAIYQFAMDSDRIWHFVRPALYANRASGTYICPNHLAGYLEMVLPVALCFTLIGRFRPATRIFLGYASLAIFGGLLVTISRGGWMAAGVGVTALSAWLIGQRAYRVRGAMLLAIVIVGALGFTLKGKLSQRRIQFLDVASQAEDVRFILWKPAWKMWLDHVWLGVGPNHFDDRFRQYRPPHRDLQTRPHRVHNDYLNTLVDWGLVGGLLVSCAWILFFWQLVASRKKVQLAQDNPEDWKFNVTSFYFGATFGLVAILFHSLVDFNMSIPANAILAVTWMALLTGFFRHNKVGGWIVSWNGWRVVATVSVLAGLIFLVRQNVVRTQEVFWMAWAERCDTCSEAQIDLWQRAFAAEPGNYDIPYRIGECYRARSWEGGEDYEEKARKAIVWLERGSQINPYDPYTVVLHGMCLDWIGEHEAAAVYFKRAHELDPNGYRITALLGWHYLNTEDYAESKKWLERSIELYSANNFLAWFYLQRAKEKLVEQEHKGPN